MNINQNKLGWDYSTDFLRIHGLGQDTISESDLSKQEFNMSWKTAEDVEKDLFEYSHLEYPGHSLTSAPPKSISEYRARTQSSRNPGLFDEEPDVKEIFISGRGKHHPGHIIRPGQPAFSTPEEDMDTRKKIREVSGLGYSNEIIEKMFGQEESSTASDEDDHDTGIAIPNLKLRPSEPEQKGNIGSSSKPSKNVSTKSKKQLTGKKGRRKCIQEECEQEDFKDIEDENLAQVSTNSSQS